MDSQYTPLRKEEKKLNVYLLFFRLPSCFNDHQIIFIVQ